MQASHNFFRKLTASSHQPHRNGTNTGLAFSTCPSGNPTHYTGYPSFIIVCLKILLLLPLLTLSKIELSNSGPHRNLRKYNWQVEITGTGSRSLVS